MKRYWQLGGIAALAALCMAPSECDPSSTSSDAGTDDAGAEASAGSPRQARATQDCTSRGACNAANKLAFSQTECETNNRIDGERADSRGCTDAYDAFLACAATIRYDCSQPLDMQIRSVCNATYQPYVTCVGTPR